MNFGPNSAKGMHEKYVQIHGPTSLDCVAPRIRELRDTGMLVALMKNRCPVTKNLVEFSSAAEPSEAVEIPLSTEQ